MDGASSSTHQSPPLPMATPSRPRPTSMSTPSHPQHARDEPQPTPQPLQPYSVVPGGFGYTPRPSTAASTKPQPSPGMVHGVVYASVYSGIPVFEAIIRGTSVMRRTSDSWVNATQILKVAGVSKSARTKILDKEILPGIHEKVQGGYGKYQGTWIPLSRGRELALQYGVAAMLSPVFDSVPSAVAVSAGRQASPARRHTGSPNPAASPFPHPHMQPSPLGQPHSAYGPPASPSAQHGHLHPAPQMLGLPPHPSTYAYAHNPPARMMYYPGPGLGPAPSPAWSLKRVRQEDGEFEQAGPALAPPADINGRRLAEAMIYVDSYGQPYPLAAPHHDMGNAYPMGPPPAKRARNGSATSPVMSTEHSMTLAEEVPAGMRSEDEDEDEVASEPALSSSMRVANKPHRPRAAAKDGNRTRSRLLSIFQKEDPLDLTSLLGLDEEPVPHADAESSSPAQATSGFEIDLVIDEQGHTALHWACALARPSVITQLVDAGADIHRGNYAGETPLIRSVLTTNHADGDTFTELLVEHLGPSIRTLDLAYRTVLHHIALIAGVKGRAASARHYMAAILELVAKEQQTAKGVIDGSAETEGAPLSLKALVDVQDVHGDTALNVAARVGNKGLVNMLLDAGADKTKANKLGLRPVDFGVEVEALSMTPAEAAISSLKSPAVLPVQHSRDILKNLGSMIQDLNDTFSEEKLLKQTSLNAVESSVRAATRKLSARRQESQAVQAQVGELEQLNQQIANLEQALARGNDDWTGRTDHDGSSGPAFKSVSGADGIRVAPGSGDAPLPPAGDLLALRKMKLWQDRVAKVLSDRMAALDGESATKAMQYRKLIALCAKVPLENVETMLDDLTTAVESDGQAVDLPRISTFLTRLKGGEEVV